MIVWRDIVFLVIAFSVSVLSVPQCQDKRVTFTEQPADVEVTYGEQKMVAFPCKYMYRGKLVLPHWMINFTTYKSNDSDLPRSHSYRNHTLFVTDLKNNTLYQCQVLSSNQGSPCVYKSAVGRLIVKSKAVLDVNCVSHYYFKNHEEANNLIQITTTITEVKSVGVSYNITYSDSKSGAICELVKVTASSCIAGLCKHELKFAKSACLQYAAVNVAVTLADPDLHGQFQMSKPIKIETVNRFIKIAFDQLSYKIHLNFINQPKQGEKLYAIRYGHIITQGCDYSLQTKGSLLNLNSMSLELNVMERKSICFVVDANNGSEFVSVKGTYDTGSTEIDDIAGTNTSDIIIIFFLVFVAIIIIMAIGTLALLHHFIHRPRVSKSIEDNANSQHHENEGNEIKTETYGTYKNTEKLVDEDEQRPKIIDKSTTYHKLLVVHVDCQIRDFAVKHFPDYQPEDGFGYIKRPDKNLDQISSHKKFILMDRSVPKYLTFGTIMKEHTRDNATWSDVYEQNRSFNMKLVGGSSFLYCARSKDITTTVFSKFVEVADHEDCRLSKFAKSHFPRYTAEWLRYCYFEFTKPEYIKPHQRLIVMKKDGSLFTGPGVRHLIGAVGDGSKITNVPNLNHHEDWKHIFIQSREVDRVLTTGSQFLFCAIMDRVRAHHSIFDIEKKCTMVDAGRLAIPGFKPELGYGYYEFKQEEYFKPHKKVIIVHESNRLYTGSGAQFFCTGVDYNEDVIMRKSKISPPDLTDKKWKHIFIQSHSKTRVLLPGTKFLYCEYKTYK